MAQPAEPPRTVRDLLALGRAFLERKGSPSARLETELLVAHALHTDRLHVFLELDRPVESAEVDRARELLVRRGKGEPCAYLTGEREFYGRPFRVGPGVLVPRSETELLVDLARERWDPAIHETVLDVGTGSGCLATTLALELEGARVSAVDLSEEALAYARESAGVLGAAVEWLRGDGLAPVAGRAFDLVVSNPPYVDPRDPGDALAPEVREHEPGLALFAPEGRPDHWVHLLVEAEGLLTPEGVLLIELGYDQAPRVEAWLRERGRTHRIHEDLAGVPRVLEISRG